MTHGRAKSKQFFFEKKNQKTFATMGRSLNVAPGPDSALEKQKFFGSFFQKRTAFFAGHHKSFVVAVGIIMLAIPYAFGQPLSAGSQAERSHRILLFLKKKKQ